MSIPEPKASKREQERRNRVYGLVKTTSRRLTVEEVAEVLDMSVRHAQSALDFLYTWFGRISREGQEPNYTYGPPVILDLTKRVSQA